ncbi:MAG: hydantoinase B/oxoprolinase family protein [Actinomycetota bacterium]
MSTTGTRVDPITLTVVWDGLRGLCADIGLALQRTAYSEIVREAGDCSAAVFDRTGRMIAQGVYSPGHLGPMATIVQSMLEVIPVDSLERGDAMITNDIYIGAGQLPDAFTVSPVFSGDELVGFVGTSVHLMDVGGASPGSQAVVGIYDNYQEGLRIPPLRHFRRGEPMQEVIELIAYNVRFPDKVMGDLRAMLNANNFGARRVIELFEKYGTETMETVYEQILDASEARTREAIAAVPDGVYSYELDLDDYGPGTPPIHLAVDITIDGSDVTIDWSRSDDQVPAGMNSARTYSFAYSFFTLKCLLSPEVPQNEGCTRPFNFVAREGSFMNPRPPAPGGGRAITIHRHFETVLGAMSKVLPERTQGASSQWCNTVVGGDGPNGKPYLLWDILLGGFAGRSNKDGAEALCSVLNSRNIPVEATELGAPVRIERLEFVPDTGGAGTHRGACAIRKDVKLLGSNNRATPITDRHFFPPHGVLGGKEGTCGAIIRDPGGANEPLHSKGVHLVGQGEVIRFQVSGAGGYGPPHERDPESVRHDVMEGYVTRERALKDYGVALTDSLEVDGAATAEARERRKAAAC